MMSYVSFHALAIQGCVLGLGKLVSCVITPDCTFQGAVARARIPVAELRIGTTSVHVHTERRSKGMIPDDKLFFLSDV